MNEPGLPETLLHSARTIALVGYSPKSTRPSHTVAEYLRSHGYRVIPVNPILRGAIVDGEQSYDHVRNVGESIDFVDVFRRGEFLDEVVDDVVAAGVSAIWFQIGLINVAAALRAESLGLRVVWDKCASIEHRRIKGTHPAHGEPHHWTPRS